MTKAVEMDTIRSNQGINDNDRHYGVWMIAQQNFRRKRRDAGLKKLRFKGKNVESQVPINLFQFSFFACCKKIETLGVKMLNLKYQRKKVF